MKSRANALTRARRRSLTALLQKHRRAAEVGVRGRLSTGRDRTPRDVEDTVETSDGNLRSGVEFAVVEIRMRLLAQIDAALTRLADGDYGECAVCRQEIATRRLAVVPFATRCLECEALREADAGRVSRGGETTLADTNDEYGITAEVTTAPRVPRPSAPSM